MRHYAGDNGTGVKRNAPVCLPGQTTTIGVHGPTHKAEA